ncbi:MAG: hypothetical protein IKF78_03765 [Atopobiaceae bacterium]|nr:hypothetical protein [Atopobiaceae bacterium]
MGTIDSMGSVDLSALQPHLQKATDALSGLHGQFESSISSAKDAFDGFATSAQDAAIDSVRIGDSPVSVYDHGSFMDSAKRMLDGAIDSNGNKTLGLKEISNWKMNEEFRDQIINQRAGFAAEIVSTEKENMLAAREGTGITTYRADDRPDLGFSKNDQYVDKIRVDANGDTVERVQTKFVGKDGGDWVKKMTSKKFDKYFEGDCVDKIECPKDFFKGAKEYIRDRFDELNQQLEKTTTNGKTEASANIQRRIDKLQKLDDMMEQSLVTKDEARVSVQHPDRYIKKSLLTNMLDHSVHEGLNSAAISAGLTFVTSATGHFKELMDGDISTEEMASKLIAETGTAGVVGGASTFITTAIANTMQSSSCNLIKSVGGSCLPASIVSFGVESYDSVMDFAQGVIGADELAYDLGHNAASIAGGALAGGKVGAMAGSVAGPVGTVAGGLIGGVVGTAVASGAYETAVAYVPEVAGAIAENVQGCADATIDVISNQVPEQVENAKNAFNDFFSSNGIPVSV